MTEAVDGTTGGPSLRTEALATLRAWSAPDESQDRLRTEYVEHLLAHEDPASRSCHPAHVTAGALVLSAEHDAVLLTLHAKARRWFHLGGHCEPTDRSLAQASLREGSEESGIDGLVLDPEPLHLDAHLVGFCGGHEQVRHLDVRFLAVAPAGAVPQVSAESLDVAWWPVHDLPTDEPQMRVLVDLALQRAAARQSGPGQTSSSAAI